MRFLRSVQVHARVALCVVNIRCPLPPPAGEKMTEAEIDALMTGQEDENGCVNYEGEPHSPTTAT